MNQIGMFVERYNELVIRQRVILLLAFLSALYLFWYLFFLLPLSNTSKNLMLENTYLSSLYEDERQIENDKQRDGKALGIISLNNKLSDLEAEIEVLNAELKEYFSIASSAKDFMSVMEDLVTDTEGLTLQEIEQLPIKPVVVGRNASLSIMPNLNSRNVSQTEAVGVNALDQASIDGETATIYKNRIAIKVKGNYSSLVQYLAKIESLSWGLFGQDIHYKVDQHPNALVSLVLYSLSLGGPASTKVNSVEQSPALSFEDDNDA